MIGECHYALPSARREYLLENLSGVLLDRPATSGGLQCLAFGACALEYVRV